MIFAVFAADNPTALGAAILANYPLDYFQVAPGQWLVMDKGTAKDVSDKLGITPDAAPGGALVIAMAGYYGRKPANLWEWIKAKSVQAANG